MDRIGSSGRSRRVKPAVVVVSVVASVILASLATFLLVFFLAVRPNEKKASSTSKKSNAGTAVHKKSTATTRTSTSMSAAEKAILGDVEKGVYEAIVDDITDRSDLERLVSGVTVKPSAAVTGNRTMPMMGEAPKLVRGGRVAASGPSTEEWLDKLDSSASNVRGLDGVQRPLSEADKPRIGARKLFDAMIKSRAAGRGVPSALEGWDSGSFLTEVSDGKVRSRDEMDRRRRRLAVAAAQEKDMFPNGLSPLAGPVSPFMEDLKARLE